MEALMTHERLKREALDNPICYLTYIKHIELLQKCKCEQCKKEIEKTKLRYFYQTGQKYES
jgi:hypothetical protein